MTAGSTTRSVVSSFVAERASDASRRPRGIAASPSSVATITTGTVSSASVSEAHRMPPVPNVGVGRDSEKKSRSIDPPTNVDEEAHPEDAEDDRRHAGQVVDRDADHAHERALLRVLAQVEGCEHSQRRHEEAHDHDHHHGTEDRREHAALRCSTRADRPTRTPTPCGRSERPSPECPWRSGSTRRRPGRAAAPSACRRRRPPRRWRSAARGAPRGASPEPGSGRRAPPAPRGAHAPAGPRARLPARASGVRSRIRSCRWLIAPMAPVSIDRISRRTGRRRPGARAALPLSVIGPVATTVPASRTSPMVPISTPHSVRSMTATSEEARVRLPGSRRATGSRRRRGRGCRPSA